MDNSVIISSMEPRIGYYASAAGITNTVEKKEYKGKFQNLNNNMTHAQIIDAKRSLEAFSLAMGDKRTTEKMYLERDIKYLEEIENRLFAPIEEKNKGRNFVYTMKQNSDNEELNNDGIEQTKSKTFTKVNNNSSYRIFSDFS